MTTESIDLVEDKGQPVKYTVLERSLIGQKIYEAGETADYDGLPAENLAPQCAIGEARYQRYLDSNRERQAKMKAEFAEANGLDSKAFGEAIAKAIADSRAGEDEAFGETIAKAIADSRAGEDERVAKIVAAVLAAQKADIPAAAFA